MLVLPRRCIAVMRSRDCASRSGLATIATNAMVSVGKKSATAARASSRLQSARSGVLWRRAVRVATIVGLSLCYRGAKYAALLVTATQKRTFYVFFKAVAEC